MPIVRILLVLLALASPALAQDGARTTAAAREASQAFRIYVEEVTKKGGRPDPARPEIAALFGRVFDLDALNALPPPQAGDLEWLPDWMDAANTINKLLTRYGSKPGPQPDLVALQRNMAEYADKIAAMMNFMIRAQAREAVAMKMFMADLTPQQRTPVRERGFAGARTSMAEFVLAAICSTMLEGSKPDNARLVASAVRDTREVWAGFFQPQDREHLLSVLAGYDKQVQDETARTGLAVSTAALQAVN
jgi:hypothetical protein